MSPRAACRLEQLGFRDVHDYGPGKSDWKAAGLPTDGEVAGRPTVETAAELPPTCALDTLVGKARADAPGAGITVVVTDDRLVMGVLRWDHLDERHDDRTADDVMRSGPVTVRSDTDPADLAERMQGAGASHVLVTDPDGRLRGVVTLDLLHAALHVDH